MANVSYDRSSKITVHKQITDTSCAATCAGMCVKKSPETLQDDGFDLDSADWAGIGKKYGGKTINTGTASFSGVISILKSGYPVITNIASPSHFVVITKFSGDDANPSAGNFTCADPWTGKSVTLSSATRWDSIYSTRYYK